MARPQGTSARLRRLTSLGATALVALATALAFARVFEGKATTVQLVAVALGSAVLAWALERRGLAAATIAAAGVLVVVLGLVAFRETTWFGLPTFETLRQMGIAATAVGEQARVQTAPTPPIDPLVLAGTTAVWAAVFSCHALAFRAGSPLLALVPPVALVAFADTVLEDTIAPQYGVLFLLGGLAVALADGMRRVEAWGPVWAAAERRPRVAVAAGRGGRRLGVAVLGVAVLAPFVVPGFGSSGLVDVSSINRDERVRIDPLVSMASTLTQSEVVEVFRVRSDQPSYWRMMTLDAFDGITWRRSTPDDETTLIPGATLRVIDGATTFRQEFSVRSDLGFPWLPAAPEPATVSAPRSGRWDDATSTITLDDQLDEGDAYTVDSWLVQPSPEDLRAAGVGGVDPRYVVLPSGVPPQIEALASRWAAEADASVPYDVVFAIQERLRDTSVFTYTTDVAWRDDTNTLVTFLTETRAGFCQQFASAMAVMLRTLNIPTRIAVGYTAGNPVGEGDSERSVTTENLHSWVEVYFEGYGWLAFEPTPNRGNPAAQPYQRPVIDSGCPGGRSLCPGEGRANDITPRGQGEQVRGIDDNLRRPDVATGEPSAGSPSAGASGTPTRGQLILGLAGLALLGLLLVPPARALARRRRLRKARSEPRALILATYDVFTQRAADLGVRRGPGETPEEFRRRIEGDGQVADGGLRRLTSLTMQAAYGASAPAEQDAELAAGDAREALRELREGTPWRRRMTGAYRRD